MAGIISSEVITSEESYGNLVSMLPRREGWSAPLVLYKHYWLRPLFAENIMRLEDSFNPRHDDIILATSPKCGTTWLKALAFALTNRTRYEDFDSHPLIFRHPQELVPYIETPFHCNDLTYVETLQSPRLLATHMPPSLWPSAMCDAGCRVVYISRDPKDTLVSRWHFENKIHCGVNKIDFLDAFSMFSEGFSGYGPFWNHCLEFWRESIAKPDRVLFLKYEEMTAEPVKHVVKLAAFLGVPFSSEEVEDGIPKKVVKLCSFENLSSLQASRTRDFNPTASVDVALSAFFRKGKVGDWMNHMSQEMGAKLDAIFQEKFSGSGLVL